MVNDLLLGTFFGGFMAAYFAVALLILAGLYIFTAIVLMVIAKKTKTENAWLAWIPIANLYLMTQIGGVPWWTLFIVLFAGLIPLLGGLAVAATVVWWWWRIAEARNKPGWYGILMLVPIVNLVMMAIIAWVD